MGPGPKPAPMPAAVVATKSRLNAERGSSSRARAGQLHDLIDRSSRGRPSPKAAPELRRLSNSRWEDPIHVITPGASPQPAGLMELNSRAQRCPGGPGDGGQPPPRAPSRVRAGLGGRTHFESRTSPSGAGPGGTRPLRGKLIAARLPAGTCASSTIEIRSSPGYSITPRGPDTKAMTRPWKP